MGTPTGRAVIAAATLGSGMTLLDGTVVNVALRTIGEDLDADLAAAAVDQQRLPALADLADPARRLARRPLRPAPDLRDRHRVVRRGLAAVRPRADPRGADRRPDPAGSRRRPAHARQPGDHPGGLRPRRPGAAPSARGPGSAASRPPSARSSAAGCVELASWRWIFLINLPLAVVTVWIALRHVPGDARPAPRPASSTCSARRWRCWRWPASTYGLIEVGSAAGPARRRCWAWSPRVAWVRRGASGAPSRCCRSASSATAPSAPPTR